MKIEERVKSLKHILESMLEEIEFFQSSCQDEKEFKDLIRQINFYDKLKKDFLTTQEMDI